MFHLFRTKQENEKLRRDLYELQGRVQYVENHCNQLCERNAELEQQVSELMETVNKQTEQISTLAALTAISTATTLGVGVAILKQ